jgi:hypothetical protein
VANLHDALRSLHEKGEDLLSLDVVTYVGDVALTKNLAGEQNDLPLDDLFKMLASPDVKATMRLVAATHRSFDRDVASICCDNPNDADRALLEVHKEMYLAAEQARVALIRLILEQIPIKA